MVTLVSNFIKLPRLTFPNTGTRSKTASKFCDRERHHGLLKIPIGRFSNSVLKAVSSEESEKVLDAVSLVTEGPDSEALSAENDWSSFDWKRKWYAVAVASCLDPRRPNQVKLLGKDLVLWKDGLSGEWKCFEDRCPHRGVPLSEGKVWPEGTLMCSYHGWRFDGDGNCVKLPQAASEDAEKRATCSPRACAASHPLAEAQGLIFVWSESGSQAQEEAERTPLPLDPLLAAAEERGDDIKAIIPLFFRDLPYDFETLVENVIDPAHAPFSHHGIQGDRNSVKYGDYELKARKAKGSLSVDKEFFGRTGTLSFTPPSIVQMASINADIFNSFRMYCTPISPGKSRLIAYAVTNRQLPFVFQLLLKLPLWMNHILFRNKVLDGDNVFLHEQEHNLVELNRKSGSNGPSAWRTQFYLATRADTLVAAFRKWLDSGGKGGPFGPLHLVQEYPDRITDRRVLLDRYNQHTKNCRHCKRALAWIERFRYIFGSLGIAFMVALVGRASITSTLMNRGVAAFGLGGTICLLIWYWLSETREKFYFQDYDHASIP